ncbi:unnamed protein product [Caenorhabditis auriculariae]|uniref:Uncharacterized protein n=1 Tax=Caenorhabditis auriculariae TaxID=2777116 RepID=A0A8S1H267_9PELO|nr:unnamed protein product [Caenorhabditis auriculariae]
MEELVMNYGGDQSEAIIKAWLASSSSIKPPEADRRTPPESTQDTNTYTLPNLGNGNAGGDSNFPWTFVIPPF